MKTRTFVPLALLAVLAACENPAGKGGEETGPPDPRLPAAQRVVDVAGGFSTTCALTEAGSTFCWGENRFGEFGDGTRTPSATPVRAAGGMTFAAITGTRGTSRLCGITPAGEGWCMGYNINGELGDGTSTDRLEPARVVGGVQWKEIATSYHTCGLAVDGRAFCWGSTLGGFASISVGLQFSCGLTAAGQAYCWGWGIMLGNGSEQQRIDPTPVAGGRTFTALSTGEEHACALTAEGEAWCWGKSEPPFGRVRLVPERVPHDGRPLRKLAAGSTRTCALDDRGRAYCWTAGATQPVPTDVRFAGLDAARDGACGYTEGGAVYCWTFDFTRPTAERVEIPAS